MGWKPHGPGNEIVEHVWYCASSNLSWEGGLLCANVPEMTNTMLLFEQTILGSGHA